MADQNKKQYIKYENTTYILEDARIPDPSAEDNGKVLGVVNGEYALKQEEGGGGGGAVTSVNGKTGAVNLNASDVHALPDSTVIPAAVTEQVVAGWGFTKNTGTYTKPSGGIPASDLASAVQTSLGKADTALQSAPVSSVNGKTGAVVLDASDVGALPDDTPIPAAVTEQTVSGWGFTKNTGTYSKPSGGIPASDLAAGVIPTVPTKVSELTNDAGYLTQHQSLANYQTKSITDTGGYFTTDTVEGALQEIGAELASASSASVPRIAKTASDTTATIEPNKLYVFPEMASLTITLATPSDNTIVNEYHFIFTSGATATTTTFPAIPGLDDFAAEANKAYEVSILEGRALVTSWEVSA